MGTQRVGPGPVCGRCCTVAPSMAADSTPTDCGMTVLQQKAVQLHEWYLALLAGGFDRSEALQLIAEQTRASSR